MKKLTYIAAAMLMSMLASCNKLETFSDFFIAFDTGKSSTTTVDEEGELTGTYVVHYTGEKPDDAITVTYSVSCGDGLTEGVDFSMATSSRKLTFLPGVYEQSIKVNWLPHDIDKTKDNTVTITLEDAGGVLLGYPGPDKLGKSITITKYSSK